MTGASIHFGATVALQGEPQSISDYFWILTEAPEPATHSWSLIDAEPKCMPRPLSERPGIHESPLVSAPAPAWDGRVDPLADTLEKDARSRYLVADKSYFAETSRHIDINEGSSGEGNARRSCMRQAQLWISWKLLAMPNAAQAALPGCSLHNHGLAVDVKGINPTMRQALLNAGWLDDVENESWHFSCVESSAYTAVRKKIAELRTGIAAHWAQDSEKAFILQRESKALHADLKSKQIRFESDVEAFNRQAKLYNDAKTLFAQQTEPYAQRRDDILLMLQRINEKTLRLEMAFAEFRQATDEIILILNSDIAEIRRAIAMSVEMADREISPQLSRVPDALRRRYAELRDRFMLLKNQLASEMETMQRISTGYQGALGGFEKQAVKLLEEYAFLKELRTRLEAEKGVIERGFADLPLMGRESMFRMGRAGTTLEEIQRQVDEVSPT